MTDLARSRRLAGRIHEIAAGTLERDVKDPRLGFVTITDVRLTPDLHDATIFYTSMGDATERAETAAALDRAKGMVRTAIGRQTGVKFTPTVVFVADELPDHARSIDDLLEVARSHDAQVADLAVGAEPAGDVDPYRAPRADDEDDAEDGDGAGA